MFLKRLLLITLLLLTVSNNPLIQEQVSANEIHEIQSAKIDRRAEILSMYLALHNSPLQYHAQDFIDAADTYGVDWKLVPAIAGVESTFGKFIPGGYNAWGWGVYGNQALGFKSWKDGIHTVTKGLKKNYIDRGLTDPYAMNRVYAASPSWGWKVAFFLNEINKFSQKYGLVEQKTTTTSSILDKTAGASAQINYQ